MLDEGIQIADMTWLAALTRLQHLELQGLPLPCFPTAITALQQLTSLYLRDTAAPMSNVVGTWPLLRELDLCNGLNHELPDINMPSLRVLNLRGMYLGRQDRAMFGDLLLPLRLPSRLSSELRTLDLGCAGHVHGLAPEVLQAVAGCVQLTELSLRWCRLAMLPECFSQLQALRCDTGVLRVCDSE